MKPKAAKKMYTSAKKYFSIVSISLLVFLLFGGLLIANKLYRNPDFGNVFHTKADAAIHRLNGLNDGFNLCASVCSSSVLFMKSIVFPEVMRYHELKDDIETESLRTLYVQFGKEYANFSVGLFQMKPSFAELVEQKIPQLLSPALQNELQLTCEKNETEAIRLRRLERLTDAHWQLVYLTAFICICNEQYKFKQFKNEKEKLQWYAAVYNAGFDQTDDAISTVINKEQFYLQQEMPGKKFKYTAIASWFYSLTAKNN